MRSIGLLVATCVLSGPSAPVVEAQTEPAIGGQVQEGHRLPSESIGPATATVPPAPSEPACEPLSKPPDDRGLIAAYSFCEGTGKHIGDSTGRGHNGLLKNGAEWTAYGRYGTGLSLGKGNAHVEIQNASDLDLVGSSLTLSLWVNIAKLDSDAVILSKPWFPLAMQEPYHQYAIEYDGNGDKTVDFYFGDTTGILRGPISMKAPTEEWAHIAFTYNGEFVAGFVNGRLKVLKPMKGRIPPRRTSLRLGVDGAYAQVFTGMLDEIRIYNRALTPQEIVQDMMTPVPFTARTQPPSQATGEQDLHQPGEPAPSMKP